MMVVIIIISSSYFALPCVNLGLSPFTPLTTSPFFPD